MHYSLNVIHQITYNQFDRASEMNTRIVLEWSIFYKNSNYH